jgi:hypothetical protein
VSMASIAVAHATAGMADITHIITHIRQGVDAIGIEAEDSGGQ